MMIDEKLAAAVRPQLAANEELLWVARPSPLEMAKSGLAEVVGGFIWMVCVVSFGSHWSSSPSGATGPGGAAGQGGGFDLFGKLFMVPFFLVGVWLILAPLRYYYRGTRTVYAITNHRVLIIENGLPRRVRSFAKHEIEGVARLERPDGSGNLTVAQENDHNSDGDARLRDVKFLGIPEVRAVERILRATFMD